jgi:hypothetical protein
MSNQGTDTFIRANTAVQTNNWGLASDNLNTWSQPSGTSNAYIFSNAGEVGGVSTAFNLFLLGSTVRYSHDIKVTATKTSISDSAGVVGRAINSNNYYRAEFSGGVLSIIKFTGGTTATTLATASFTEIANTTYTIRFLIQGFGTNNLQAKIWATSGSEPANWMVQATDTSVVGPGQFGIRAKLSNTANRIDFSNFSSVDPTTPLPAPSYTVIRDVPYGQTLSVPAGANPPILAPQIVTDLQGWGNGAWLRYQLQWSQIELSQGLYLWDVLDDAVAKCNNAGIHMWLCMQGTPSFRLTRDGYGSNTTLQQTLTGGSGSYTSLSIAALPAGAYIPHQGQMTIDYGAVGAENVYVWNPSGTYKAGTTSIGISSSSSAQVAWTPANNHAQGAQIYEATGGPVLPNATDMATYAGLVAARYNGTAGYGKIDVLQVENEAYDTATRIGGTTDTGGSILAPVYAAAYSAIKATFPTCVVAACAVRKVQTAGLAHIKNWIAGLVSNLTALDALDFHYYRDGTTDWTGLVVQDPTLNTYTDSSLTTINCPNAGLETYWLKTIAAQYGLSPQVVCGEFGWTIYDDGLGVTATTNATYTAGTAYTSLSLSAGLSAKIPNGTAISIDWQTTAKTEIVYAYGQANAAATTIQITTNPLGNGTSQVAWTAAFTHVSVTLYAATTQTPVTWSQDFQYSQSMYDLCQATGASHCFRYTLQSTSVVTTTTNPQTSTSIKSWTQMIDNQYRYLPGYYLAKLYASKAASIFWTTLPTDGKNLTMTAYPGTSVPLTGLGSALTMTEANP